jgi:hypothetical protein
VREARAELAAMPPKPIYPSRMPKGWVPPEITAAIAARNPAVEGVRAVSSSPPSVPASAAGNALVPRPPPPVPPAQPEGAVIRSRLAEPDDPPEVHAAYAQLEKQFDKADWWLMGGTSNKRRTE